MATRFGAVSPAQTYATKVRWLVGCLVSVILVLAVAIIFIAQGSDASEDIAAPIEQPVAELGSATVSVLVAAVRVEEGDRLEAHMFNEVPMDEDRMPMGVVRVSERHQVVGQYAKRLVNANMPLVMEDVAAAPPLHTFKIPPGYRAATIEVDARTGVEGFAKPNSRVDVLWTYKRQGRQNVATIARFVKILSVQGITRTESNRVAVGGNKKTTITLLVTEKDAKKIELARTLGKLTLSLVGDEETASPANEPDAVTIADLVGRPATSDEPAEVANDGVMYTSDPRTGRQLRYVLRNGRWSLDRGFAGSE